MGKNKKLLIIGGSVGAAALLALIIVSVVLSNTPKALIVRAAANTIADAKRIEAVAVADDVANGGSIAVSANLDKVAKDDLTVQAKLYTDAKKLKGAFEMTALDEKSKVLQARVLYNQDKIAFNASPLVDGTYGVNLRKLAKNLPGSIFDPDEDSKFKLTEEQQHMAASYIAQESTRLTEISSKLLTMHNAKEETTTFRPVDVEEMFLHIQRTYPTVVYKVNWSTLLGDLNLLTSLFNNLVDNAVKASPEGSPVELTADINVITIRDHGKGMSDEVLAYVNHPPKHKKLHSSGGLGVPLCHQIAKVHGAKLSFQRGTDGGTVATVMFYNSLID